MVATCNLFSGKDKARPSRGRISPFGAKLEVGGKKRFLWCHPRVQTDHLQIVDKTFETEAKSVVTSFLPQPFS